MIKFTFYVTTPRGGHYNSHYARSEERAKAMIEQWNTEFRDTGYKVILTNITKAIEEELPEHYVCW
jgi:hypothetical protein